MNEYTLKGKENNQGNKTPSELPICVLAGYFKECAECNETPKREQNFCFYPTVESFKKIAIN